MTNNTLFISRNGAMRSGLSAIQRGRCKRVTIKPRVRHAHTRDSDFGFEVTMFGSRGQFVGMI